MEHDLRALPAGYLSEISKLLDELDARPRPSHSPRGLSNRGTLGDFASITCFRALVWGFEDLLGPDVAAVVLLRAGRLRGQSLVEDWGVGQLDLPLDKIAHLLDAALGKEGTRLCAVHAVHQHGPDLVVDLSESISPTRSDGGSLRDCFTLGAVWGALETLTGRTYSGSQTASLLDGDPCDQFTFRQLDVDSP